MGGGVELVHSGTSQRPMMIPKKYFHGIRAIALSRRGSVCVPFDAVVESQEIGMWHSYYGERHP